MFILLNNSGTISLGFSDTGLVHFTHSSIEADSLFALMMVFWQLKHGRGTATFSSENYTWSDFE